MFGTAFDMSGKIIFPAELFRMHCFLAELFWLDSADNFAGFISTEIPTFNESSSGAASLGYRRTIAERVMKSDFWLRYDASIHFMLASSSSQHDTTKTLPSPPRPRL
ncbi:hypothetical protein AAC387_Pa12g1967 [Persea americana]